MSGMPQNMRILKDGDINFGNKTEGVTLFSYDRLYYLQGYPTDSMPENVESDIMNIINEYKSLLNASQIDDLDEGFYDFGNAEINEK